MFSHPLTTRTRGQLDPKSLSSLRILPKNKVLASPAKWEPSLRQEFAMNEGSRARTLLAGLISRDSRGQPPRGAVPYLEKVLRKKLLKENERLFKLVKEDRTLICTAWNQGFATRSVERPSSTYWHPGPKPLQGRPAEGREVPSSPIEVRLWQHSNAGRGARKAPQEQLPLNCSPTSRLQQAAEHHEWVFFNKPYN